MAINRGALRAQVKLKCQKARYAPVFFTKNGVSVLDFSLISEEVCIITIDYCDLRNFFAICKNMCYNILLVKYKGILAPFMLIIKRVGLVLGITLFSILAYLLNGVILEIDVIGSASIYKNETVATLNALGVKKYSTFHGLDYGVLSSQLLKQNERLSFVSIKKQGNRLVVNAELSTVPPTVIGENKNDLLSKYNGVIEEIAVLRGTALKQKGDLVLVGDVLVGSYQVGKNGDKYPTFVIARVKILVTEEYFYSLENPTEDDARAYVKIAEFTSGGEAVKTSYEIKNNGVKVTVTARYVV
ncbi:MAG: sporulation protein YqfD [Clostridia bacterium]|nr:sporulation protein YqfD [Clostridia bacterium]